MKKSFLLLMCITFFSAFAKETTQDLCQITPSPASMPVTQQSLSTKKNLKVIAFFSFPIPGIGLSMRTKSFSLDATARSLLWYNSLSFTASPVIYFSDKKIRPYISAGLGVIGIISQTSNKIGGIFPLRVGVEGERVFVDIGGAYVRSHDFRSEGFHSETKISLPDIRFGIVF